MCTWLALLFAASARAQSNQDAAGDASPAAAPAPELHAPELLEFVPAEYPPEALAARGDAVVVLRLSIDTEGRVTQADVVELWVVRVVAAVCVLLGREIRNGLLGRSHLPRLVDGRVATATREKSDRNHRAHPLRFSHRRLAVGALALDAQRRARAWPP